MSHSHPGSLSIIPLIEQWETYVHDCATTNVPPSLPAFSSWLGHHLAATPSSAPALVPVEKDYASMRPIDRVGMFIWRLSRFIRTGFKRHFADSPLQTVDEFLLLGGAHQLAAPTKTQLFEHGLLETTTGLQMLARLVRHGLLLETADAADRRLKRIKLTAAGQIELAAAVTRLQAVGDELFHILSPADLEYVERILQRLDQYQTARDSA